MSPGQPVDYGEGVTIAYRILFSYLASVHSACVVRPEFDYLLFGKFMSPGLLSSAFPILSHHVGNVILLGSKKQMGRINAWRIIAAMKNLHSIWNGSIAENPGCSISENGGSFTGCYRSVSTSVYASSPFPARIGIIDFRPESIWKSCRETARSEYRVWVKWNPLGFLLAKLGWCSNIFLHKSVGLICAAPPDRQIAGAISL